MSTERGDPDLRPEGYTALLAWLARYEFDLPLFVREMWSIEPEPWQETDLLVPLSKSDRERRISIASGHGVGKTAGLAFIAIHHILCHYPQKTIMTAPTSAQMWDALWPETKMWIKRLPPDIADLLDVKAESIHLKSDPDGSFISARTSKAENPEAMAGIHAPWVLLIGDEASGIPDIIFESASGSMSGQNTVMILTGNPVRGQGYFFETHHRLKDKWHTQQVSVFESRWSGGQVFADEIAETYGANSNAYRVRVLGQFPVSEDDTVIPWDLVESAGLRDVEAKLVPVVWGVDVARYGSDRSALCKRKGNVILEPLRWWVKKDLMETAALVKVEYDQTPQKDRPVQINVDVIGMGAGVVDRLKQLGLPAAGINVSETPSLLKAGTYRNLRAELWFDIREWFMAKDCKIPHQEELTRDLTTPRYKFTPQGRKIYIESKDEMKKRGRPSPDLAEALMLTFASDAIILAGGLGSYGFSNWSEPVHSNLKGIV